MCRSKPALPVATSMVSCLLLRSIWPVTNQTWRRLSAMWTEKRLVGPKRGLAPERMKGVDVRRARGVMFVDGDDEVVGSSVRVELSPALIGVPTRHADAADLTSCSNFF